MAYLLVVDDDKDFANGVAKVLKSLGHKSKVLLETKNVLSTMEKETPALVILDVMFPENSSAGFELAREIRSKEKFAEIPILILTAINQKYPVGFGEGDISQSWLPITSFLEKPVDLEVLKKRVTELLTKK